MRPVAGNSTLILMILFGVSLLSEVDYQVIPPLLPLLAIDFHVDPGYAGRAVTVYALSAAMATLLFGHLSDQLGRKPFVQIGLFAFAVTALLSALSSSMNLFLLTRFLTGVAAASFAVSTTSYAADYFHYGQRGRAMGFLTAAYFVAAIIGIPSATLVATAWGWRVIYFTNSILSLILGLSVVQFLVHSPAVAPKGSIRGLGFDKLRSVLTRYALRGDMLALLTGVLLTSGATVGFITYLASHLHKELHLSMRQVGGVYLWCGLASLIGAPLSGSLSDRFGKKALLIFGGAILACGMVIIPVLPAGRGLWTALGLAGMAMAFRMAPLLALLTEIATPGDRGTLLAVRSTLSQLGIATISFAASYCYLYKGYLAVGVLAGSLTAFSTLMALFFVREPGGDSEFRSI